MKTLLVLLFIGTAFTLPPRPGDVVKRKIEIPMEEQVEYMRKLARYYFEELSWRENFQADNCPEYIKVKIRKKRVCYHSHNVPIPILPPLTACQMNEEKEGCKPIDPVTGEPSEQIDPNCDSLETIYLCLPPVQCDILSNLTSPDCIKDAPEDCNDDPTNPHCKHATKCDLEDDFYAETPECQEEEDPCGTYPELCLTACDLPPNKHLERCVLEKCQHPMAPEYIRKDPICTLGEECEIDRCDPVEGEPDPEMVDPSCCPAKLCQPYCKRKSDEECKPPPPDEECIWGQKISHKLIDLTIEPIQKQMLDKAGVEKFVDCYKEFVRDRTEIKVMCFEDGMQNGFTELEMSIDEWLEENEDNNLAFDEEAGNGSASFTGEMREVDKKVDINDLQ